MNMWEMREFELKLNGIEEELNWIEMRETNYIHWL